MTENGWKMRLLFNPTYVAIRIWNSRYVCENFVPHLSCLPSLPFKIVILRSMKMNHQLIAFTYSSHLWTCHSIFSMPPREPVSTSVSALWWQGEPRMSWMDLVFVFCQDNSYFSTDRMLMYIDWWECNTFWTHFAHWSIGTLSEFCFVFLCLLLDMAVPEPGETQQSVCEAVGRPSETNLYFSD